MNSGGYNKILAMLVMTAGLGLIVWTASGFIDRNYPELLGHSGETEPLIKPANGNPSRPRSYNVQNIIRAHLFGKSKEAAPSIVQQAPQTKLKLDLLGIMASANTAYARAMIRVNSKRLKTYGIGDQIEDTDAKVYTVEEEKVILERSGKFESLPLIRAKVEI
jgi:general secretion pathway protein C